MLKVGDRVRCIDADLDLTDGKIYTVEGVFDDRDKWAEEGNPYVIDDAGDKRNALCGWFEPVTEGPVRTVARREIVPGVYGRVKIGEDGWVGLTSCDFQHGTYMTAEELDSAAMVFSQLAEALRDG